MNLRRKRHAQLSTTYDKLEPRQLLATTVFGTSGDDLITVSYVDETTVDIENNGTLMSDVDISEGLLLNLLGGQLDKAIIDHQITADVTVVHAEQLELTGGDNVWDISGMEDPNSTFDTVVVGIANNNLRFAWLNTIQSGDGIDTFTANVDRQYLLHLYGGDGNDLFRFVSSDSTETTQSHFENTLLPPHVIGHGEGGNDRFNFFGSSHDRGFGGEGFDIADYRSSTVNRNVWINQLADGSFHNERVFANPSLDNSVSIALSYGSNSDLNWYMGGDWTIVKNFESDSTLELMNFNSFKTDISSNAIDNIFVMATNRDIDIHDADNIHIGSKVSSGISSLDTIQHNIGIHRSTSYQIGLAQALSVLPPIIRGTDTPTVVISDQAGDGINAWAESDGSIRGLGGGRIHFGDVEIDTVFGGFQPQIEIFGSNTGNDTFVIEKSWTGMKLHGNGGDDTFMIGGVNGTLGDLDEINGHITATGGAGTDRVYLNDQGNQDRETKYVVRDDSVKDQAAANRFNEIKFTDQLEVLRINGSNSLKDTFTVSPSSKTRIVVDGQNSDSDTLRILGSGASQWLVHNAGAGSWYLGENFQNVYFYGVEDPDNSLSVAQASDMNFALLPVRMSGYRDIANTVITSQSEFNTFVSNLDTDSPFSDNSELVSALNDLTIDFSQSNFALYTHTENSGSIQVNVEIPYIKTDEAVVFIDRFLPQLGTADMAYYGYGYVVNKSLAGITFDLGEHEIYLENV